MSNFRIEQITELAEGVSIIYYKVQQTQSGYQNYWVTLSTHNSLESAKTELYRLRLEKEKTTSRAVLKY